MEQISREKSVSLEQYVQDQKAIAQLVQTNSTVIENGIKYQLTGEMDPKVQAAVAASLKTLFDNTGNIYENLFVTFGSAGYADCLGNATLHDVGEENFYQQCLKNGYYFGNNVSPVTGRPVYVIAYAIYSPLDGSFLGTVNMSIDMASMGKDIVSSEKQVTVLDLEGNIIATNGPEDQILTNIAQTDPDGFAHILDSKTGHVLVDLTKFGQSKTYLAYCTSENFVTEVAIEYSEIAASSEALAKILASMAAIFSIVCVIILTCVILAIVNPLKKASDDIEKLVAEMNQGRGDLTKPIKCKSHDEISLLVSCINKLMQAMSGIISSVQKTTNVVTVSSNDIRAQIGHAEDEINTVSSTMEEMSASSQETSASLSQVMIDVDNVADLVRDVNTMSIEQANYASSVVDKVQELQENSAIERERADRHLREVTESLQAKIANAKQVQEIANLTDEILNITSQTNLLSLNASIEAARAGEAGKGFAVVADEIRQLADSSKEAANRIQEVTKNVIVSVEDLASEAEKVTEFMKESNDSSHEETEKLTVSYSTDIQKLAESMNIFRNSSDDIANNMESIRSSIEAVNIAAEETAQGITNVAQATVELSNELMDVVDKTGNNVSETNSLSSEINRFTV